MRFVRPREVLKMIGVSRTTLWRLVTRGLFPAPVWISARGRGFRLDDVEEWMQARTAHDPLTPEGVRSGLRVALREDPGPTRPGRDPAPAYPASDYVSASTPTRFAEPRRVAAPRGLVSAAANGRARRSVRGTPHSE